MPGRLLLLLLGLAPGLAHPAVCYTLLSASGAVTYQSMSSPIDLSRPISEELQAKFPGHHLVFGEANLCPVVLPPSLTAEFSSEAGNAAAVVERLLRRYARATAYGARGQ